TRQQRRVYERGQQGVDTARQRVRAALHAAVAVEQARHDQRIVLTGEPGEQREPGVEQLDVGVHEQGDLALRALDTGVACRPEPGVGAQLDHLRAALARERRAAIA